MSSTVGTMSVATMGSRPGDGVSTGTTIMAVPCRDGVVLGADSRVSTGTYIVHRYSDKIVQLDDHIFCCRSGSAADTQALTDYVRYYLQQLAIETGRPPRVKTAAHLLHTMSYQNKDRLLAAFILAGWDPVDGSSVYSINIGGSCVKVPFALSGSGSTYIWGLADAQFQTNPDMSLEDARAFVKKAISHAMARDGGSGGILRTVVVTPDGNHRDTTQGNQLPFGPTGF